MSAASSDVDPITTPGSRVVFLHAHPDDETLATGALLAWLAEREVRVAVVTATRGEQGEVVPGPLSALAGTPELVAHREAELARALAVLGVPDHAFLGTPPARAPGVPPRRYTDSGMRWLDAAQTLAGPGETAGPDSLTSAAPAEAAADLAAYLRHVGADAVVSYDGHGGYGHPDHVACHHIAAIAARLAGVPLFEVVSEPLLPVVDARHFALAPYLERVRAALGHYASQLVVDGDEVVHVGGQRQPILTGVWLRRPAKATQGFRIGADAVSSEDVAAMIGDHLTDMYATSPADSVHSLDLSALADPSVTLWSARSGNVLLGCVALKQLPDGTGEVKSMRTAALARGRGVGRALLNRVIEEARTRGLSALVLETGTEEFFAPARRLYRQAGFVECGPFADYVLDPLSTFFRLDL